VIRDPELGSSKASALGRTSKGPVDPARVIKTFMQGLSSRSLADSILGGGEEGIVQPQGTDSFQQLKFYSHERGRIFRNRECRRSYKW
jgi:hypothetical protein